MGSAQGLKKSSAIGFFTALMAGSILCGGIGFFIGYVKSIESPLFILLAAMIGASGGTVFKKIYQEKIRVFTAAILVLIFSFVGLNAFYFGDYFRPAFIKTNGVEERVSYSQEVSLQEYFLYRYLKTPEWIVALLSLASAGFSLRKVTREKIGSVLLFNAK